MAIKENWSSLATPNPVSESLYKDHSSSKEEVVGVRIVGRFQRWRKLTPLSNVGGGSIHLRQRRHLALSTSDDADVSIIGVLKLPNVVVSRDNVQENSDFTIIGDTFFGSLHAAAWVDIAVSEERADHSDLEGKGIDLPIRG
ncbi:hypothetical protein LWI28_003617 [Acer negundo]|uniref:Uncharacterized protein n=1 Tax=Acer negundo TaxID=4023 RepID=A0AAD5JLB6_ACENE|nr:hypothetical protein LWI28_003617 [Acer negundo]